MVSTKYLCCTIDNIAAAYPLAELMRSGLFTHERTSSMHNSTPLQLVFNPVSMSPFLKKALCRLIHRGQIYNSIMQKNSPNTLSSIHEVLSTKLTVPKCSLYRIQKTPRRILERDGYILQSFPSITFHDSHAEFDVINTT